MGRILLQHGMADESHTYGCIMYIVQLPFIETAIQVLVDINIWDNFKEYSFSLKLSTKDRIR